MEQYNSDNLEKYERALKILNGHSNRINGGKVIAKVWKIKSSGQKLITIPSVSDIEVGDYVELKKV